MRELSRVIFLVLFVLSGCANTYDISKYEKLDQAERTVKVPIGSEGLRGKLKQALMQNGWKLTVDMGPTVTEGTVGEKTRLERYDTFKARYRLSAVSRQFDTCLLTQSPAINFDISFIDNVSGAEVFTMSGTGCESIVVEKFVALINSQ